MEDKTGKIWFGISGDACFYGVKGFTVFKNKDGKAFYNGGSIIKNRKTISAKGTIVTIEAGGLWRYDGSTFTNVTQRGASAIIKERKHLDYWYSNTQWELGTFPV